MLDIDVDVVLVSVVFEDEDDAGEESTAACVTVIAIHNPRAVSIEKCVVCIFAGFGCLMFDSW